MKRSNWLVLVLTMAGAGCGDSGSPGAEAAGAGGGMPGTAPPMGIAMGMPGGMGGGAAATVPPGPAVAGGGGMAGVAGASGASGGAGASATAGAGGSAAGSGGNSGGGGSAPVAGAGSGAPDAGMADAGMDSGMADPKEFASGLHELFMQDKCTGLFPSQPDTCIHALRTEKVIDFGGKAGTEYEVVLRVRGLFEPTTINGGRAPLPQHPYFKVGGTVGAADWSRWHIEVSNPAQTYWLNHYPATQHIIYQEDFEAPLRIAGGAKVTVRVIDGNDRQMDNATKENLADRHKLIPGVTTMVLDGQMLRLDVVSVTEQ